MHLCTVFSCSVTVCLCACCLVFDCCFFGENGCMLPRRKHARMVTTQEVHCWAYAAYARTQALYSHERTNKRTNARQRVRGQTHAYTHTRTHTRRKLKHHAMVLAILEPTSPVSSSLDLWVQDRCAWHLVDHALHPTAGAEVQCQLFAQLHLGECFNLQSG